jgi:hypothetical protein
MLEQGGRSRRQRCAAAGGYRWPRFHRAHGWTTLPRCFGRATPSSRNGARRYGSDLFATRLMLTRVVCMSGAAAVEQFYWPGRFTSRTLASDSTGSGSPDQPVRHGGGPAHALIDGARGRRPLAARFGAPSLRSTTAQPGRSAPWHQLPSRPGRGPSACAPAARPPSAPARQLSFVGATAFWFI